MTSSARNEYDTPSEDPAGSLPGLDDTEQQCWQLFLDSSTHLLDTLNRKLKAVHKLTLVDVLLLDLLARSEDGSARMSDLAQELVLIPSRVTAQVRRLEAQGLVRRQACDRDRRSVIARITERGRLRLEPALRTYSHGVRALYLNALSRQQASALGDSCRRVSTPLKAPEPATKPPSR